MAPQVEEASELIVSGCQNNTISEIVKGTYRRIATHHGRPVHRKDTRSKGLDVLVYYWDSRDGPELSGWWFGPSVGGDQVWAFHSNHTAMVPPYTHWNVPHDGPIDPTFTISYRSAREAVEAPVESAEERYRAERAKREEDKRQQEDQVRKQIEDMRREREDFQRRMEEMQRRAAERSQQAEELRRKIQEDIEKPLKTTQEQDAIRKRSAPEEQERSAKRRESEEAEERRRREADKERRHREEERRARAEEEAKKKDEERKRAEEEMRRKKEEWKRQEEKQKEEEEAKRREEESKRKEEEEHRRREEARKRDERQKQQEEEQNRQQEEMRKRLEAEAQRSRESQATLALLEALLRFAKAVPEDYVRLKMLFDRAVSSQLPLMSAKQQVRLAAAVVYLSSANARVGEVDTNYELCWSESFTKERCCDNTLYGPRGDLSCWEGRLQYEPCCTSAVFPAHRDAAHDALQLSRSCWREGFTFQKCCTRALLGGDPGCWDQEFTFERCCRPPEASAAALLFEDVNCKWLPVSRASGKPAWPLLQQELLELTNALGAGAVHEQSRSEGGLKAWSQRLARSWGGRNDEGCDLGSLALAFARLLLCTVAQTFHCNAQWEHTANTLRTDSLDLVKWLASEWPLLLLLQHLGELVGEDAETHRIDVGCHKGADGVDWPLLHKAAKAEGNPEVSRSIAVTKELYKLSEGPALLSGGCSGGLQWQAAVKLGWCIELTPQCVATYQMALRVKMEAAAQSGASLKMWLREALDWNLFQTEWNSVQRVMRHKYTLGLTVAELELLGVRERRPLLPRGCAPVQAQAPSEEMVAPLEWAWGEPASSLQLQRCRAQCGKSRDSTGRPWPIYGLRPQDSVPATVFCRCSTLPQDLTWGNCTEQGRVPLFEMPVKPHPSHLVATLGPGLGRSAPVLSQAARSLDTLDSAIPVFVTMVFGHMSRYIQPFCQRVHRLAIKNIVIFVLDDAAEFACRTARAPVTCLRGFGRTALQKYVVAAAYLALGRDIFWFDFDSVWLQNPWPVLQEAIMAESKAASEQGLQEASVFSAIDFDSKNCPMNAFFLVRASPEATHLWFLSLLQWIYMRPYVHDQLAWCLFLGMTVLVDGEPLPTPPPWAQLDPNVFGNAARFSGLGFSAEPEDLVFFHFFDGWNSNQPEAVEQYATATYKGVDMFKVLYGDDQEAARAAIAKSRLPKPKQLKDCSHMDDLGLGIEVTSSPFVVTGG